MSKAFTKEAEGGEVYDDLPDRPVSPHNLVTPKGLELIEAELARLHGEHAAAQDADDRPRLAKINRDLRYWTSRRATAQVVEPPQDATEVRWGPPSPWLPPRGRPLFLPRGLCFWGGKAPPPGGPPPGPPYVRRRHR